MGDIFSVYHGEELVGSMQVKQKGLYYHFLCKCTLHSGTLFTVEACRGDKTENLGICIPYGETFGLQTSLPVKNFGTGQWHFCIRPKHNESKYQFHPIREDTPFPLLDKLQNGYLSQRNGQLGIEFSVTAQSPDPQDSDQIP